MSSAVHSLVPNLRVSPLALSPRLARFDLVVSVDDREGVVTKKVIDRRHRDARRASLCLKRGRARVSRASS